MRACKVCAVDFMPTFNTTQAVCSPRCAAKVPKLARKAATVERQQHAKALIAIKPRSKLVAEAQAAVNRYVRLRDRADGCISCHLPPSWGGQWHASHFRSTGAASSLRFNLWNIHKACSVCNNHKSGNIGHYLPRLVAKIGALRVEWLQGQNERFAPSRDYLIRMKQVFTKKARRMELRNDEG